MKRQPLTNKLTLSEQRARQQHRLFAQNATEWLTVTEYASVQECVQALRGDYQFWVTDLSQQAVPLTRAYFGDDDSNDDDNHQTNHNQTSSRSRIPFPPKLALVMGTEAVGCSQEMLQAADCRVYLPLRGFADSLNLSVATALVVQQVLHLSSSPTKTTKQHPYVANMPEPERQALREQWFPKLARQRLLTSRQKKEQKRLQLQVRQCRAMIQQQQQSSPTQTSPLTPEQVQKIAQLPNYEQQLAAMDAQLNETARAAVADLIQHPPDPLTDLRRADDHRVTFVGRNTKAFHAQHWQSMPATAAPRSLDMATAAYFRRNVGVTKTEEEGVATSM